MSGTPYNSVLRSGVTRHIWLIVFLAMLVPVSLALFARWFEAEERRVALQNQELRALSRDKASALLFNGGELPGNFASGLEGRYLVVLDAHGTARFSSTPVPAELVELFSRRALQGAESPGGTSLLAWYASGREWRGAMTFVPASQATPGAARTGIVVVFAPGENFGSTFTALVPTALGLLALVLLIAFAVAAIIAERYVPAMQTLHRGLVRLRDR